LKALRDQRSFEYARDEAIRARDEAIQARNEAQQQLAEAQRQELIKRIHLAQRLLGHSLTSQGQLLNQPLDQLRALADELEKQLLA